VIAWVRSVPPVGRAITAGASRQAFSEQPMPDWWLPLLRANLSREGTWRAQQAENPAIASTPLEPEKIPRPVLVIHGTDDRFVPFAVAEDLYQRTQPDSELVRVEGGSHMLPITHTDLLAQRIAIFSAGGGAGGVAGGPS
jgi:pimeloyl-ACP methyl ester carboxylesterase